MKDKSSIQLTVDDQLVMEPKNIADHFKSIFNTSCPIVTPAYYV
jgi:hypothetical protein